MPSTYSNSLRIELMATGEKTNTWGNITNTNLGTLLESAIAGVASVTHNDSADYSLTASNGADDEARHAVLNIGGTLTAARNVVCPSVEKLYVVKNATSGGFSITIKTSGGSGITIPNGKTRFVYCDGTNVVDSINDLPSATTFDGVAAVTASSTTTFTNKTFTLSANTLSGTTAQFNAALSDGSFATLAGAETLTNKTLTSPTIAAIMNSGTLTLPATTDTIVARATTDTLTNKTISLGSNTVSGTTAQFNTALSDGSFATLAGAETLTNKTLTAPVIATIVNTGTLTLPTATTTLVGRTTTDTLTNKTLTSPVISTISNTGTLTLPTATTTLVGRDTTDTLTNKTISLGSNTVSGTTAQFNTALSDGSFATLAGSETLTNKVLSTGSSIATSVTGVTQTQGDNSTKLATTAYVDTAVAATGGSADEVAQMKFAQTTTEINVTTAMPGDNTIPQITEGSEIVTVSITPRSASSKIIIEAVVQGALSANDTLASVAVFIDSTADAIGSTIVDADSSKLIETISLMFEHSPGDTSLHTYRVRAGPNSGTFYVNQKDGGNSGHSTVGPVSAIKVTEVYQ